MFDVAFIQEEGSGRLMHESVLVRDHCIQKGIDTQLYTPKRIQRRQLPLTSRSLVFGNIDCMHGAMRQLKIPIPEARYYPASLRKYLHRNVWQETLGNVRTRLHDAGAPVFAKPASRAKIFTGRVFSNHADFYHTGGTSRHEPVWCSDVVAWRSEYRVYVIGTDLVSIDHYDGDEGATLDLDVVTMAVKDYAQSGEAPVAYGIDFGVLASGETALVEANDGYSLGAYQIGSNAYGRLIFARWLQLIETSGE